MAITDTDIELIEQKAEAIRETIIEMLVAAGSGHTAGPLDMADIFAAFYFHILRHDPKNPDWEDRDRLILSNGHIVPVRYATMAHAGYFPVEECLTLRKFGSRLQGHPERLRLGGLETTSGPLGEGLSQGAAMAYAFRMDGGANAAARGGGGGEAVGKAAASGEAARRVYVLMGDGEQDEGNVWEAVMWTAKNKLSNLTAVIDRNNIQIDGMTEDVMPLDSLRAKYEAFGWHVLEVDGHNIRQFIEAVDEAKAIFEKPTLIIAHTIPGKGVPEIEFDYRWHGVAPGHGPTDKVPADKQGEVFLKDIRTMKGRVPGEYA